MHEDLFVRLKEQETEATSAPIWVDRMGLVWLYVLLEQAPQLPVKLLAKLKRTKL